MSAEWYVGWMVFAIATLLVVLPHHGNITYWPAIFVAVTFVPSIRYLVIGQGWKSSLIFFLAYILVFVILGTVESLVRKVPFMRDD